MQLVNTWDLSPDGQAALFAEPDDGERGSPERISVVVNWFDELRRLVPP